MSRVSRSDVNGHLDKDRELAMARLRFTVEIKSLMAAMGVSQRELADRVGVSESRMSTILSGTQNLQLATLSGIGWALGIRWWPQPVLARPIDQPTNEYPTWVLPRTAVPRIRALRPLPTSSQPVRWLPVEAATTGPPASQLIAVTEVRKSYLRASVPPCDGRQLRAEIAYRAAAKQLENDEMFFVYEARMHDPSAVSGHGRLDVACHYEVTTRRHGEARKQSSIDDGAREIALAEGWRVAYPYLGHALQQVLTDGGWPPATLPPIVGPPPVVDDIHAADG